MNWSDSGYLLSKNKFGENSLIAEFFTESHGKISGIIYGATSKKIRNYLQIGNKFHINYNSKNENKLGYLSVEIEKILTPLFFEDKKKTILHYFFNEFSKIVNSRQSDQRKYI